jgi:hypothetical protein
MKQKIKEYMGRSNGIGHVGLSHHSPDNNFSSRLSHTKVPLDYFDEYKEAIRLEKEKEPEDEEDEDIFENRIYKDGKYSLEMIFSNLALDDKDMLDIQVDMKEGHHNHIDEDNDDEEENVEEMSSGGVAGAAVPLGRESDASMTTGEILRKRQEYFRRTYGNMK